MQILHIFALILGPILAFAAFWCLILQFIGSLSRWRRIAQQFPLTHTPTGKSWQCQSGKFGWADYNNVLHITFDPLGLCIQLPWVFSFGHTPLCIPWSELKAVGEYKLWRWEFLDFQVGEPKIATIRLSKKIFEEQYLALTKQADLPTD